MITTKRGKRRQVAHHVQRLQRHGRRRRKTIPMLNAKQYVEVFNESAKNDGYDPSDYDFEPGVDDAASYDWQKAVFRNAPVRDLQLGADRRQRPDALLPLRLVLRPERHRHRLEVHARRGRVNLDFNANSKLSVRTSLGLGREDNNRIRRRRQPRWRRDERDRHAAHAAGATAPTAASPAAPKGSATRTPSRSRTSTPPSSRRCARSATSRRTTSSRAAPPNGTRWLRRARPRRDAVGVAEGRSHVRGERERRRQVGPHRRDRSISPKASRRSSRSRQRDESPVDRRRRERRVQQEHAQLHPRRRLHERLPHVRPQRVERHRVRRLVDDEQPRRLLLARRLVAAAIATSSRPACAPTARRASATDNRYGLFPAASVGWVVSDEPFARGLQRFVNAQAARELRRHGQPGHRRLRRARARDWRAVQRHARHRASRSSAILISAGRPRASSIPAPTCCSSTVASASPRTTTTARRRTCSCSVRSRRRPASRRTGATSATSRTRASTSASTRRTSS